MIAPSRPLSFQPARARGAVRVDRQVAWRRLRIAIVVVDAMTLVLALGLAGLFRLQLVDVLNVWPLMVERHVLASILAIPIMLLILRAHGLYDFDQILVGTREYARIANALTYGVLIVVAASFFAGGDPLLSRSWLMFVWLFGIVLVIVGRFSMRRVVRWMRRRGAFHTRVAVVGASTFGVAIAEQLQASKNEGLDIVGFLDEYIPLGQPLLDDLTVIGRPGDLPRLFLEDVADEYILVPHALPHQRLEELTRLVVAHEGPVVRSAVNSIDLLTNGVLIAERGHVPLVTLRRARITGVEAVLKRTFDIVGAALALLVLGPLALAVAARAAMLGKWPILERQLVYGVGGTPTPLWVFRPGITRLLSVRGVPALLAVLRGQLSLAGPRPVTYVGPGGPPSDLRLTTVKPGLTGPWRLEGAEASLADQELEDLTYVRNYSIWADLHILWASACRVGQSHPDRSLGRWYSPDEAPQPAASGTLRDGRSGSGRATMSDGRLRGTPTENADTTEHRVGSTL